MTEIYKGILREKNGHTWLEGENGEQLLEGVDIWSGYVKHWLGIKVCGRYLDKNDYATGGRIVLLWPDEPVSNSQFFELYYNERLIKYTASICGHNAININGNIYNFSHLLNENEVMTPEEYF